MGGALGWLRWALRGDAPDNPDFGFLIIRNMLPGPSFEQAILRIEQSGSARTVMGGYLPRSSNATRDGFEALGCPAVSG